MRKNIVVLLVLFIGTLSILHLQAQPLKKSTQFTHADTLRGTYGPSRDWWDVLKYDLHVSFNIPDSTISGYNLISFKQLKKGKRMQIDLQEPMILDSIFLSTKKDFKDATTAGVMYGSKKMAFTKDGNAYFIDFSKENLNKVDKYNLISVFYHGKPRIARRPPWDGGLIWKKSKDGSPWVSIACQGLGASVWYPCKDHQVDEPDSAEMHITCPDSLMCVGNGRYRGKIVNGDGTATYDWAVVEPINNYCIIPYIGKYVHFGEVYKGEKGDVDMDYWVLENNLDKAKEQFKDAPRMMKAFEYWFGPYPFAADGYKLVEAPHLGMEHQSATAYGNGYRNGYSGRDLSGTGWGLKWDFIIVHESGHEWFANNVTSKDIADMWVHEGFTNYSETLFTDFWYGKDAGNAYVQGTRKLISNDMPIIGHYNVNQEGSGDMYYKGGNMLHTIRQLVENDERFRQILRGLNTVFYHKTVTTQQVEDYISKQSNIMGLNKVFDQYLRTTQIPVLEYKIVGNKLSYRYVNCVQGFMMPVKISIGKPDNSEEWCRPTEEWETVTITIPGWEEKKTFVVNPNFYIITKKVE